MNACCLKLTLHQFNTYYSFGRKKKYLYRWLHNNDVRLSKSIKFIYQQHVVKIWKSNLISQCNPEGAVKTWSKSHTYPRGGLSCESPLPLGFKSSWLHWRQWGKDPDKHSSLPSIVTYNTPSTPQHSTAQHSTFPLLVAKFSNDDIR